MTTRPRPLLALRGGGMATDSSGYYPNFAGRIRFDDEIDPRNRNREPRPSPRRSGGGPGDGDDNGPWVPPGGDYEAVEKDWAYDKRLEKLGIGESLLRPAEGGERDGGGGIGGTGRALGWQGRGIGELTSGEWRPTRARFEIQWPDGGERGEELDSEWYQMVYTHLYVRVSEVVSKYFGYGDIKGNGESVWVEGDGLPKQFRWYVAQVAKQDNAVGGWDHLLEKQWHREYLVRGIIGKLLEREVFEELLFGADELQKKMLEAHDELTIHQEGYQRTNFRSRCVRTILTGHVLTPDFWPCVDRLSLQLTTLLLPLLNLMDNHFRASRRHSLRSFHQDLHGIVAVTGFLSIGMRWSYNIFRMSSPFPGQAWDLDQQHVDDAIYNASKAATDRADKAAEEEWNARRARENQPEGDGTPDPAAEEAQDYLTAALDKVKALWGHFANQGEESVDNGEGTSDTFFRAASRLAKVQIIVWPMLQRFATVGKVNPESGVADGENITTVFKSQVVYYSGRTDQPAEQSEDHPSLEDWIHDQEHARMWAFLRPLRWIPYLAGTWLLLSLLARYSPLIDDILLLFYFGTFETAKYVAREVLLLVLEGLILIVTTARNLVKLAMFSTNVLWVMATRAFVFGVRWLPGRSWLGIGTGEGASFWRPELAYPDLNLGAVRDIAKEIAGEVVWKTVTLQVPAGYTRTYASGMPMPT